MPSYNNKHYFQLFTDNPFGKTESGAEKRELFSVVQSMVGNFLVYCNPYGQPPHYERSHFRTPTSLRTIQESNHLTSVVTIDRPTCDQLMQPPEKLGTCTSPPLMIYLNSQNKNYTKRTMSIKISSIPHFPKEKRKIHKNFNKQENTKLAL